MWSIAKELTCQYRKRKRHRFDPWVRKMLWSRKWQPTPVFLAGESPGQRSLEGYNLQGHKESDTTEGTGHTGSMGCIPLLYSSARINVSKAPQFKSHSWVVTVLFQPVSQTRNIVSFRSRWYYLGISKFINLDYPFLSTSTPIELIWTQMIATLWQLFSSLIFSRLRNSQYYS